MKKPFFLILLTFFLCHGAPVNAFEPTEPPHKEGFEESAGRFQGIVDAIVSAAEEFITGLGLTIEEAVARFPNLQEFANNFFAWVKGLYCDLAGNCEEQPGQTASPARSVRDVQVIKGGEVVRRGSGGTGRGVEVYRAPVEEEGENNPAKELIEKFLK